MGWYVTNSAHQGIVADEQTGKTIAVTYDKAHAPVVAASQDLLAALEGVLTDWDALVRNSEKAEPPHIQQARAAIAKAGEL